MEHSKKEHFFTTTIHHHHVLIAQRTIVLPARVVHIHWPKIMVYLSLLVLPNLLRVCNDWMNKLGLSMVIILNRINNKSCLKPQASHACAIHLILGLS